MKMHCLRIVPTWLSNKRLTLGSWILLWWGNVRKKKKSSGLVLGGNVQLMLRHWSRNWMTSMVRQWRSWQTGWIIETKRSKHSSQIHWRSSLIRRVVSSDQHCWSPVRIKPRPWSSPWSPNAWLKRMSLRVPRTRSVMANWRSLKKIWTTNKLVTSESWIALTQRKMQLHKSRWTTLGISSARRKRMK